jgi:hypothetical protein
MIPLLHPAAAAPGATVPSVFAFWLGGAASLPVVPVLAALAILALFGCHLDVELKVWRITNINAKASIQRCTNPDDASTCKQEVPESP